MSVRQPAVLYPAFLFALTAGTQIPNTLLYAIPAPPVVQRGAGLGFSVTMDGNLAVAGVPADHFLGLNSGVVKVFDSATGRLLHSIVNPTPGGWDGFGSSVGISGTLLVVGAPSDDADDLPWMSDTGIAHVYDLAGATPTVPVATLKKPNPMADDRFGCSVAISGTRIVVGAPGSSNSAGSAYVYDFASATPTEPVVTLNDPQHAVGGAFGSDVAISDSRIVIGAPNDSTSAYASGSAYVFDLTAAAPTAPMAILNNPSPGVGDRFGSSVAVSNSQVVVGADGDDAGAENAGSAYVYDMAQGTPTVVVATLNSPNPAADDAFGVSVAIAGSKVVVGAWFDNTGASDAGSAFVYDLAGTTPKVPLVTLNNPGPADGDLFGGSVGISGMQVVIGAYSDDTRAADAGSAYVYDLAGPRPPLPVSILNNAGLPSFDSFGSRVAVSGTRVVVGAHGDDTHIYDAGGVYVYDFAGANPTVPAVTIHDPDPHQGDRFGISVAISGNRVVVGALSEDTLTATKVYVYDLLSHSPTLPVATLNYPGWFAQTFFGLSVAISGTLVVVGAPGESTGAYHAGSAYVYNLTSATPALPVVTLNNPAPGDYDNFGRSVGISGTRVIIGSYLDGTGAYNAGSAYVYDLAGAAPMLPVATLNNPEPNDGDNFGSSVAISGTRVIVGTPGDDTGARDAGSAFVYDLGSATPAVPLAMLNNPDPAAGDSFGDAVAISGALAVVGAYSDDKSATNAGSAYLYDLAGPTPSMPEAALNKPGPASQDYFGYSVAMDGVSIVIGNPGFDFSTLGYGNAYIFRPNLNDQDGDGLLDSWELTYWPTTTGHSAADDFDHDGYPELLELALGLNPTIGDPGGLPPATVESGYLTFTVTKRSGVTYEAQSAGTLLPAQPASFSATSTRVVVDDATTFIVRDNVAYGTAPTRFIRLKVTAAP